MTTRPIRLQVAWSITWRVGLFLVVWGLLALFLLPAAYRGPWMGVGLIFSLIFLARALSDTSSHRTSRDIAPRAKTAQSGREDLIHRIARSRANRSEDT